MTFVHPNSAARPARIRILGTTPPPPPPRRGPNRPLLVACLVVAALGVGITLLARPQITESPSQQPLGSETIELMGHMNLGARLPDARTLRVLSIHSPDFDSAARVAAARERATQAPQVVRAPSALTPPPTTGYVPSTTKTTPPVAATSTGPDQPPDPATPNTTLDQS